MPTTEAPTVAARHYASKLYMAVMQAILHDEPAGIAAAEQSLDILSRVGKSTPPIARSEADQSRHISTTAGRVDARGRWIESDQPYSL